jgi:hypothetical protein
VSILGIMAMAVGFFGRYIRVVQGKPPWDFGRPSALGSARGRRTRGGACRTVVRSLQLRAAWCRKHEKTAGPAGHGQSRADELALAPTAGTFSMKLLAVARQSQT